MPAWPANYEVGVNTYLIASVWIGLALVASMLSKRLGISKEGESMTEKGEAALPTAGSISPAHANALAARLLILEEDCREIERYLDGFEGIYYAYIGTLSEPDKRATRATLKEILRHISKLQRELGLRRQQIELHKLLNARLSHIWVTLHEGKSQYLRAYGTISDELRTFLDPRVEELLRLLSRLRKILGESQEG